MKRISSIMLLIVFAMLTACGGGSDSQGYGNDPNKNGDGGDGGGGNNLISTLSVSLVLLGQVSGQPTTSISPSAPGILRATVTDNGTPLASTVVTFTTSLGTLDPAAGTALTDSNGVATINLQHNTNGAGTANAEVTVGDDTASDDTSFSATSTVVTTTIDMGNGTGTGFTPDVIDLGGVTNLSAGGQLTATVNIVETSNNNQAYTPPASVTFTSTCMQSNTASMDSPVSTVNGKASSTYTAQGCSITDTITATTSIGGNTYTAIANVTVTPPTVGRIKFESASHRVIAIKGTGGIGLSETSDVTFTVLDSSGNPVPNQLVQFSLSPVGSEVTLNQPSATSNANGQVVATVQSGTINTSVTVTATVASTLISTTSVALAVSTGRPDNDSFSISADVLNPPVWECDGGIVPITVRASDHFNNPAPDGTSISFRTEGGSIEPNCDTKNGECTVNWKSSNTRPTDARVTILATAIGEESYIDSNPSNGRFDDTESFSDLPEAWLDSNEDGIRDTNEEYLDINGNLGYDFINNRYNGALCTTGSTVCDPGVFVHVRDSLVLVMASVNPLFTLYDTTTGTDVEVTGKITLLPGIARSYRVDVQDIRGQQPPAGSTISVATTNGKILGGTSTDIPSTSLPGPASLGFIINGDQTPDEGALSISVDVPGTHCQGSLKTTKDYIVSDVPPPP